MKTWLKQLWHQSIWFAIFFVQCIAAPVHAVDVPVGDEALRQGEAMYLNGILPSGEPVQAKIFGDVEAAGEKVACAACHLRSGMGMLVDNDELLVLPVSGPKLFSPIFGAENIPGITMKRLMFKGPRPAYTDETLAAALLTGIDPTGRSLDQIMPRYLLDKESTQVMIAYLKNLSAIPAPGVTEHEIRFATVIAEGVSAADRDAMVLPLTAFLQEEWNARLSIDLEPSTVRLPQEGRPVPGKRYRKASLDVWTLHGSPETWTPQLEAYSSQRPVFALLAGLVPGEWSLIHKFCEKNKIPSIFPITDLPALADNDWYTLYFSRGLHQEGEVAAKFLALDAELPPDTPVIQVFRNTAEGKALVKGFTETWQKNSEAPLTGIALAPGEQTGKDFWKKLAAANRQAALVVWLTAADLAGIESLAGGNQPPALFLSATLLGEALPALPDEVRDFTFIGHPTRLPGDGDYTESIVANWLKIKKIPNTNMTISSKMFVLKSMLSKALVAMGNDFHRDFFLDIMDGAREQGTSSVTYPVLSFGPGDRYAAKGCYVVQLTPGTNPELIKKVDWLFYAARE